MNRRAFFFFVSAMLFLLSCVKEEQPRICPQEIVFEVYEGMTKVSEVTTESVNTYGFYVSATTGASGSETADWTNVSYTKSGDYFKGGKNWPSEDPTYHFYASNILMTHNATGATVNATNTSDVVCAYKANPYYNSVNGLTFKHIFARLGWMTVSAGDGWDVSGVTIYITPKTGGRYNIRSGAEYSNGTGWETTTTGSPVNIANSTPGTKSNDIYLVPGVYSLVASWIATDQVSSNSRYFNNVNREIYLEAGSIANIETVLSGGGMDVITHSLVISSASYTANVGSNINLTASYHTFINGVDDGGVNVTTSATWEKMSGFSYISVGAHTGQVSCTNPSGSEAGKSAHIKVTYGGQTAECDVNFNSVISRTLSLRTYEGNAVAGTKVIVGGNKQLRPYYVKSVDGVTVHNGYVNDYTCLWTSSNTGVLTVTNGPTYYGLVEGISVGSATVTARYDAESSIPVGQRPTASGVINVVAWSDDWDDPGGEIEL